jgi:two-component system chemotaxis sensor kinase CheA
MAIADDIVAQFRTTALARVEAIEQAWSSVLASLAEDASLTIQREIHTLKGESRMVGFTDVNMVCHKLEDLVDVARARGYAVDDDFDLAVTMALRFMAMLIRKRVGADLSGIDLPGFVRHIDNVLKRHEHTGRGRPGSVPPLLRPSLSTRMTTLLRTQLGPAAVDAFIEYAVAHGPRRDRLRSSWHLLRDMIGIQRAVVSAAQLGKYKPSVLSLAKDLGKDIEIVFEIATSEVTTEVLAAIDVAALHLVRNAADHGIEQPDVRAAAGKRATGTIVLRGGPRDGDFVLEVEDDGSGIDYERVHARAIELGLVPEGAALDPERLVDVMCHPGFSTRTEANEISGRGVGLDAVRGSAVDLGGSLTAQTTRGVGTTWTMKVPVPTLAVRNTAIRAPGLRFPIVLDPVWQPLSGHPKLPIIVDVAAALGLAPSNSISTSIWWFTNGELEVGLQCGGRPAPVDARRLITTPATSVAEVATVDSVEGLLLRPERIPGVAR